jgi:hypothetical protein
MEFRRRFVFRGNAAAFGGRIVRPKDVVLAMPGSSLPVTGGRSRADIPGRDFEGMVRFASATTFAEGLFDDVQQQIALSHHKVREETLSMSTRAFATIRDLVVGPDDFDLDRPQLTVRSMVAELRGRSPKVGGLPPIAVANETDVQGVVFNGRYRLKIELHKAPFQRYETHDALVKAASTPAFVREHGECLMEADAAGQVAPWTPDSARRSSHIYATIVRKISWDGDAYPGSEIERHSVRIPEFGRALFGELLITRDSRRLTMLRLELGSFEGGSGGGPEVDVNGSWSP